MSYKLGSLFDGSGGFPLAGALCDIEPIWASEVEPYPIAVTKSRFPKLKHLGDISKINGGEVEPVDIITFGSPCQDLSVAGKRAGLKHEANGDDETTRSGLFMEAVRIIKEMREETNGQYPRFAVWENVPGAFSSNKGEDFRIVLEELIKIIEPSAIMPEVPQKGWAYADTYVGDGWSIAYRVLDAQYWGVPQRRRRIYLVADFGGERAKEILFKREGLSRYFKQGRTPWQTTPTDAQGSPGADDREGGIPYTLKIRSGVSVDSYGKAAGKGALIQENLSATLGASQDQYLFQPMGAEPIVYTRGYGGNTTQDGVSPTLEARAGTGGNNQPIICLQGNGIDRADTAGCNGKGWKEDTSYTLNTIDRPAVCYAVDQGGGKSSANVTEELAPTLTCTHGGEPAICTIGLSGGDVCPTLISRMSSAVGTTQDNLIVSQVDSSYQEKVGSLCARDYKGVGNQYVDEDKCVIEGEKPRYIVRRLTPTECARLQGFADRWGHINTYTDFTDEEYQFWLDVRNTHAAINGKKVQDYTKAQMLTWYNKLQTDSSEYKMWGNGIALPTALYVLEGIAEALDDWMD